MTLKEALEMQFKKSQTCSFVFTDSPDFPVLDLYILIYTYLDFKVEPYNSEKNKTITNFIIYVQTAKSLHI